MSVAARPHSIRLALRAAVASLALISLEMLLAFIDWEWTDLVVDSMYVGVLTGWVGTYAWLIYLWYQQRRWARSVYMLLLILNLAFQAYVLSEMPPATWIGWIGRVAYIALDLIILGLLLSPSAREWFGTQPSPQSAL